MYFKIITIFIVLFSMSLFAQEEVVKDTVGDTKYREDQFYIGLTFNLLTNKPASMDQNGFSGGFHAGFIRDMPINKRRNVAIGVGLGFSMNTYNQNLFVGETENNESIFTVLDPQTEYNKNWFSTYLIEAPIQFRWRTSTASSYKFWRIYSGLQLGYVYAYKFNFEQTGNHVVQTDVPEFERLRLGATFTFGYETFNFHFYYGLNPLFKNATTGSNQALGINTFKLGLMFYIL
ncbi:MAG: porin family protein [Leeuwenhoekiella sp.]